MPHQVLARTWRPHSFSEIIGQEHVTRALINALDNNRLHHAYMFTGTRGIGKTTLARILAKCLNCEKGVSSTPCGVCSSCQEIDDGCFLDLIEVDAASRTKVEDTRELLENVQYAPTKGRYKVYLIDEVHMLSGHSFNALLKTLEEPPPHVLFVLATTDPQKVPITVLSRCLQFNLKQLPQDKISSHLQQIAEKEQISYEATALNQIARAANGSIRDALSLLEQAIAYGNNQITAADVAAMLGTIELTHIYDLLQALASNDAEAIFTVIFKLVEQSIDFNNVLEELISALHHLAILKTAPNLTLEDWGDPEQLTTIASAFAPEDIQLYYQIALIGRRDLPLAPSPKLGFEMVMLRMLAFRPKAASQVTVTKPTTSQPTTSNRVQSPTTTKTQQQPQTQARHSGQPKISAAFNLDDWSKIFPQLALTGPTKALAEHCSIIKRDEGSVELALHSKHAALLNSKHEQRLSDALTELLQKPTRATISVVKDTLETPNSINTRANNAKQQQAEEAIQNDSNVQSIIKTFDATIVPNSIISKKR